MEATTTTTTEDTMTTAQHYLDCARQARETGTYAHTDPQQSVAEFDNRLAAVFAENAHDYAVAAELRYAANVLAGTAF
jgi:hypothetical protein